MAGIRSSIQYLYSVVLHISHCFPLLICSPVSCFLFSSTHFLLSFIIPTSIHICFSSLFAFLCGRVTLLSDLQGITPRFVPLHLQCADEP